MYHRQYKSKDYKISGGNIKKPMCIWHKQKFLRIQKNPQTIKEKNDKLNYGKIEIFYLRDTIKKMKGQAKELEQIFAIHISDKRLFQNT